jgi:hypothetical protein
MMTACRPDKPLPQCAECVRQRLPTEHTGRNGVTVADLVIDPTAVLRVSACPFFVWQRAFPRRGPAFPRRGTT